MRIVLTRSAITIDEERLIAPMTAQSIYAFVGDPVSTREIPMHPTGVRKAHVGVSGIVWYVDYPEDRVSHLHLALYPEDTPEQPRTAFGGSITLNGVDLSTQISEAIFPYLGEVAVAGHHHYFSYNTGRHSIGFSFTRHRNRLGKRSGPHKLSFVSVNFRDNDQGAAVNSR